MAFKKFTELVQQVRARSLLRDSIESVDFQGVETALRRGANPNTKFSGGETPLMLAARAGNPRTLTLLLECGADPRQTNQQGYSALMCCAFARSVQSHHCVSLLLVGSDLLAENREGLTAMHLAINADRPNFVEALMRAGADPLAPSKKNISPLNWARQQDERVECVQRIEAYTAGSMPSNDELLALTGSVALAGAAEFLNRKQNLLTASIFCRAPSPEEHRKMAL